MAPTRHTNIYYPHKSYFHHSIIIILLLYIPETRSQSDIIKVNPSFNRYMFRISSLVPNPQEPKPEYFIGIMGLKLEHASISLKRTKSPPTSTTSEFSLKILEHPLTLGYIKLLNVEDLATLREKAEKLQSLVDFDNTDIDRVKALVEEILDFLKSKKLKLNLQNMGLKYTQNLFNYSAEDFTLKFKLLYPVPKIDKIHGLPTLTFYMKHGPVSEILNDVQITKFDIGGRDCVGMQTSNGANFLTSKKPVVEVILEKLENFKLKTEDSNSEKDGFNYVNWFIIPAIIVVILIAVGAYIETVLKRKKKNKQRDDKDKFVNKNKY